MASEEQEYKYQDADPNAAAAADAADQYNAGTHDLDGHAVPPEPQGGDVQYADGQHTLDGNEVPHSAGGNPQDPAHPPDYVERQYENPPDTPPAEAVAAAAGAAATGAAASNAAQQVAGSTAKTTLAGSGKAPTGFSTQGLTQKFSWNIFRYFGDIVHLAGVLILLGTIKKNASVTGLSLRTAMVYAVLFTCRYLDLFTHKQPLYLVFFKASYLITAYIMVYYFGKYFHTFERSKDTVNIAIIFGCCFLAAWFTNGGTGLVQTFWIYSQYLEAFALVPQYVFCYRDPTNRDFGRVAFIMCIGIYRCCYAANWIYKKVNVSYYSDVHSWLGGIFEILFFFDYLMHHCGGVSILKTFVLGVDNTMRNVSDRIEYKVLGTSSVMRDENHETLRKRNVLPTTNDETRELDFEMELAL